MKYKIITVFLIGLVIVFGLSSCKHDSDPETCTEEKQLARNYLGNFERIKDSANPTFDDVKFIAEWAQRESWDNQACESSIVPPVKAAARKALKDKQVTFIPILREMCSYYPAGDQDIPQEMYSAEARKLGTQALEYLSEPTDSCNHPPRAW